MPQHHSLPAWLEGRQEDADPDMAVARQRLLAQGVNSRGWRLYLDYGDALFLKAATPWFEPRRPASCARNAVAWLTLLQACEMDIVPPPELLAGMIEWGIPDNALAQVPPLFLRAVWKGCVAAEYEGVSRRVFFEQQVQPVARWFFTSGTWKTAEPGLLKAGWDSLVRRHDAWVAEQKLKETWTAPVPFMEWDHCRFVLLNSEQALIDEGRAMQHCVGDYGDRCRDTSMRIYSVTSRKHGGRIATLSVERKGNGRWDIDQLKGPSNADVDPRVWHAAGTLLRTLEQASYAKPAQWIAKFKDQARATTLIHLEPDEIPF